MTVNFNVNLNLDVGKIAKVFGVSYDEALERIVDFIEELESDESENDNAVVSVLENCNVFDR